MEAFAPNAYIVEGKEEEEEDVIGLPISMCHYNCEFHGLDEEE